jgi:hypothetical protein
MRTFEAEVSNITASAKVCCCQIVKFLRAVEIWWRRYDTCVLFHTYLVSLSSDFSLFCCHLTAKKSHSKAAVEISQSTCE